MDQKEQQDYLKILNEGSPDGHEALKLEFQNGIRKPEIICSCGCKHPTGGVDQEFVIWGICKKPSQKSSFMGDNLPPHAWQRFRY